MSTTETKVTHTPGPWKLGAPSKRRMMGTDEVEIQSENGSMIALLYRHNWADQDEPNAHLIAAAPEMLEALEQTRTALRLSQAAPKLLAIVETAIAKAKGCAA